MKTNNKPVLVLMPWCCEVLLDTQNNVSCKGPLEDIWPNLTLKQGLASARFNCKVRPSCSGLWSHKFWMFSKWRVNPLVSKKGQEKTSLWTTFLFHPVPWRDTTCLLFVPQGREGAAGNNVLCRILHVSDHPQRHPQKIKMSCIILGSNKNKSIVAMTILIMVQLE